MTRRSVLGFVLAAAVVGGGAVLAWAFYFSGGSGEPSTELTLPTVDVATTTTALAISPSTTARVEETVGARAFVIDQAQSTASFIIDEELRGSPNRVVGSTDQMAGQVVVDPSDPARAMFSSIVVNARTFQTDSPRRDQAIRSAVVLDSGSDEFELITFDVVSTAGLDGAVAPGERIEFTLTGDLTIKGHTNRVTFDMVVTFESLTTIRGTARATVLRTDYGIGIPSVPGVANVSEEVDLRLDFVAIST